MACNGQWKFRADTGSLNSNIDELGSLNSDVFQTFESEFGRVSNYEVGSRMGRNLASLNLDESQIDGESRWGREVYIGHG